MPPIENKETTRRKKNILFRAEPSMLKNQPVCQKIQQIILPDMNKVFKWGIEFMNVFSEKETNLCVHIFD
jgi:hypothetical protein